MTPRARRPTYSSARCRLPSGRRDPQPRGELFGDLRYGPRVNECCRSAIVVSMAFDIGAVFEFEFDREGSQQVAEVTSISIEEKCRLGTKRMGRPSVDDPCTPRAERPPRQPRTLSVTVVGCSMGIWARTLRIDRGMDGLRGPSDAHFVVCSLLVLGPKYQILSSRRFCVTETPEKRNAWMKNG